MLVPFSQVAGPPNGSARQQPDGQVAGPQGPATPPPVPLPPPAPLPPPVPLAQTPL